MSQTKEELPVPDLEARPITMDEYHAHARCAGSGESRSAYIERVLRRHFRRRAWPAEQARDIERINAAAGRLNAEMAEVLQFRRSALHLD
jgi:hypothetical protein